MIGLFPLQVREAQVRDSFYRLLDRISPGEIDSSIVVVEIDQASLDALAERGIVYPWPRELYGGMIRLLDALSAQVFVIDLLFTEPSPQAGQDEAFARAMEETSIPVVLAAFAGRSGKRPLMRRFLCPGREEAPPAQEVLAPLGLLQHHADAVGNVAEQSDPDGVFRQISRFVHLPEGALPSLSHATFNIIQGKRCTGASFPLLLPALGDPARRYPHLSVLQLLSWAFQYLQEGEISDTARRLLSGRIVFLGASAPGLRDVRPSPYRPTSSGVDLHAWALDAARQQRALWIPPWGVQILMGLGWVLLLMALRGVLWRKRWGWMVGEGSLLIGVAGLYSLLLTKDLALPLLYLVLLQGGTLVTHLAWRYEEEWRKRRWIRKVLGLYLSPEVLQTVLEHPDQLRLGGERREITVYFSDIRGFTTLSEKLDPEEIAELLNRYLSRITAVLFRYGATLDKYLGDGVMAFWNAPLSQPDHVDRACQAALEVQRVLAQEDTWEMDLWTGIGLHTGPAVVGNLGSPEHFDYTAVGDTVNTASRLEGLTRHFGVPIVVSEKIKQQCREPLVFRSLGWVQVKGRQAPLKVYELRENPYPFEDVWEAFLESLRRGDFSKARRSLQRLPEDDPVVRAYLRWLEGGHTRPDGTLAFLEK